MPQNSAGMGADVETYCAINWSRPRLHGAPLKHAHYAGGGRVVLELELSPTVRQRREELSHQRYRLCSRTEGFSGHPLRPVESGGAESI